MTVTVLCLPGFGFESTDVMKVMYSGFATSGDNVYVRLPEFSLDDTITTAVALLNAWLDTSVGDVIVLAHSRGAIVASEWLAIYGVSKAALATRVSFILCANPCRKYGHPTWPVHGITRTTPDNTAFTVTDVARQGDGWCNWPRSDNTFNLNVTILTVTSAIVGLFTTHRVYFTNIDLNNLETTKLDDIVVGNTTYYLMP